MNKKRRKNTKERYEVVRLWSYDQAKTAMPYLKTIAGSLREHWLDAQGKGLELKRLNDKPGRADRAQILKLEHLEKDRQSADTKFQESLEELLAMHVFPIDVNQGLALIPFREKEELAWYVFDLFDPEGMKSWRFHNDPLDTRRPLTEIVGGETVGGETDRAAS